MEIPGRWEFSKGTVYRVKKDGSSYSILHHFGSVIQDGEISNCDLLLSGNSLYGTAIRGGKYGKGIIFKITELNFWIHAMSVHLIIHIS